MRGADSNVDMKVALYVRISTKDKGQETANQLEQLREFCGAQGWIIVVEYEDHESGGKAGRTRFQAMMGDAARRRFDLVVFWTLDRSSREGALETLQHLNWLSRHGVAFRTLTEPYLDSCGIFKDPVIAILGTIAKQQRVRISQRVRAGLNRAGHKGPRAARPSGDARSCSLVIKCGNFETKACLGAISQKRRAQALLACGERC